MTADGPDVRIRMIDFNGHAQGSPPANAHNHSVKQSVNAVIQVGRQVNTAVEVTSACDGVHTKTSLGCDDAQANRSVDNVGAHRRYEHRRAIVAPEIVTIRWRRNAAGDDREDNKAVRQPLGNFSAKN